MERPLLKSLVSVRSVMIVVYRKSVRRTCRMSRTVSDAVVMIEAVRHVADVVCYAAETVWLKIERDVMVHIAVKR